MRFVWSSRDTEEFMSGLPALLFIVPACYLTIRFQHAGFMWIELILCIYAVYKSFKLGL